MAAARTERSKDAPAKGRFITFEGGEGSGKSTQVRRLMARLAAMGIETVATREPGGSPEAERLRGLLLSGDIAPFGPTAEALVFTAARIDHIDKTIRPALDEGCFVICDRFTDSTRAYQGATGKVPADLLADLEKVATGSTMPALTIVLDVPVETGLARAKGRGEGADRFEQEKTDFHEAVRQSFIATAKS
jgi:dTMP kinase